MVRECVIQNHKDKYIINCECYPNSSIVRIENKYFIEKVVENINRDTYNNLIGFEGKIENADCSQNLTTQENHVIETTGGSVVPKNMVFRTTGGGSFFRDDALITVKGDIRGQGANDLSISRTLCSQVASGNYSSILGGQNNTASGSNSVVVGGNSNVSSGENGSVVGGVFNSTTSKDSIILSGNNSSLQAPQGIILSGESNNISSTLPSNSGIFTGISNSLSGNINAQNQVIVSGNKNSISGNNFNGTIMSGQSNSLIASSSSIITGNLNIISSSSSGLLTVTGNNNTHTNGENSVILDGSGNNILVAFESSIISGATNTISTRRRNLIGTGYVNNITSTSSVILSGISNSLLGSLISHLIMNGNGNTISSPNSVIMNGRTNNLTASNSAIITGERNSGSRSGLFLGSGISNTSSHGNSSLITGLSNVLGVGGGDSNGCVFLGSGVSVTLSGLRSAVISGQSITVPSSSANLSIMTGINHLFTGAPRPNSFIGTGIGNRTTITNPAMITGFSNNCAGAGNNSLIVSGEIGSIDGFNLSLISGKSNSAKSTNNFINTGLNNLVDLRNNLGIGTGIGNINYLPASIYFTGLSNQTTVNSGTPSGLFMGTGTSNFITTTSYANSCIINGIGNTVLGSNNAMITGQSNSIATTRNFIGTGQSNLITSASNVCIVTGISSEITSTSATNSCIGAGSSNKIIGINSFVAGLGLSVGLPASSAFGQYNLDGTIGGSGRIFMVGNGTSGLTADRSNAFSVLLNGIARGNSFENGGADFAEYFESYNGQSFPAGHTVCINQDGKIVLSVDSPDEVIGVIVKSPAYIGNFYQDEWKEKYQRDSLGNIIYDDVLVEKIEDDYTIDFSENEVTQLERRISEDGVISYHAVKKLIRTQINEPIYENYPIYDLDGNFIRNEVLIKKKKITQTSKEPRINPNYNPNLTFIPRTQRPEWNIVGLKGQVWIEDGQRVSNEWAKISNSTNGYCKYLI
jgi:hypothetical protein